MIVITEQELHIAAVAIVVYVVVAVCVAFVIGRLTALRSQEPEVEQEEHEEFDAVTRGLSRHRTLQIVHHSKQTARKIRQVVL